jgi:esterase/lipase superfamily enzyme
MPEADASWYMDTAGGGPRWETYHIHELIPYIDAHFRTIATRTGRAVAGLSMGGFGAFAYAARHPDLFVAAASFSGVLDLLAFMVDPRGCCAPMLGLDPAQDLWQVRAHDPVDLAPNLRGVRLFMSAGNGKPGPFDQADSTDGNLEDLEAAVHATLISMEVALHAARIPVTIDDYGAGIHAWPYWQRELHRALPLLLAAFAQPPAPPRRWSYRTADAAATVWGYTLAVARPRGVFGFTDVAAVQPQGLMVRGVGTVSVETAPIYRPGRSYAIRQDAAPATLVVADAHGRLHLTVHLGTTTGQAHISISAPGGR